MQNKHNEQLTPEFSELGRKSDYDPFYNPDKLFPISRKIKRDEISVPDLLPFYGFDIWNHYEVSWLNQKGKPVVALAEIIYGAETPNIIESKSMKLYFNSFNNYKFTDANTVKRTIEKDLSLRVGGDVFVSLHLLPLQSEVFTVHDLTGECLDDLDIECISYAVDVNHLSVEDCQVEETIYSNLLKSNCLVTNQPDWGSVQISYKGNKIKREGLLQYIVSFRNHNEFHEQCVERIFMDIMRYCHPDELTVYARYTRRGGLDINPIRSTRKIDLADIKNTRLFRQ